MNANWEKRYSFRLQEEDEEIYNLLARVPDNKRSETIRQMLRFAVRTLSANQKSNEENRQLLKEVQLLREDLMKQHLELLTKIESSLSAGNVQAVDTNEDSTITEQAIDDSASAMLSSFGIEF
ncbi:hypothetical protein M3152_11110 [Sporosarcina luteola]|uniref:hypothetical protein n=1 Tax=Sporosarcina luteola TaxID=582850 RepID=UPI0020409DF1|nr:hypothetical protein [Sporosarcina luteola]MCM3638275.1 hypothetical protein [Sporosarcina luteola]